MRQHRRAAALIVASLTSAALLAGCAAPVTIEGRATTTNTSTPTPSAAPASPQSSPEPAAPAPPPEPAPPPVSSVAADAVATPRWLDEAELRRADQLISAFENSTTVIAYDYAENIGDDAGVTTGRAGFTTKTCDALTVIDRYSTTHPGHRLERFAPELRRLCAARSGDTTGLPEADYIVAWQATADDPAFRAVQDAVVHEQYYVPAMREADRVGVVSPLTRAQIYDTSVHQGAGNGPASMQAVVRLTVEQVGTPAQAGEAAWLDRYLTVRTDMLLASGTKKALTTDRVASVRRIAATGNLALAGPVTFTVYGDTFTIA